MQKALYNLRIFLRSNKSQSNLKHEDDVLPQEEMHLHVQGSIYSMESQIRSEDLPS